MKVLVTGGTGTISSGLVHESVNRGFETYAITRGSKNNRNIDGAKYFHADIWDTANINIVIGNLQVDVVVECLAYNVEQLKISLENFSGRCSQYVFISTAGIYNRIDKQRIEESDPKKFTKWSYTKNKIDCENYLKEYATKTGLKYTIIRPTVTYGDYRVPFPIATRTPGWTFFDRMKKGQLMLASDNVKFSVIHIDDFSNMVVSLFGNKSAINEDFHIVSNDNDVFWDDIIEIAGRILNVKPKVVHVSTDVIKKVWPEIYNELAYNKNLSLILDDRKIKKVSEYEACIDINDGMKNTIKAMKKEFENKKLGLDNKWNDYCNAVIYYAYKKQAFNESDYNCVKEYIEVNGEDILKDSFKKINSYNKKQLIKKQIKKIIKVVINDR